MGFCEALGNFLSFCFAVFVFCSLVVLFAVLPFAYKLFCGGPCPIWMSISVVMNPIEGPFLAVRGSIHFIHLPKYFPRQEFLFSKIQIMLRIFLSQCFSKVFTYRDDHCTTPKLYFHVI